MTEFKTDTLKTESHLLTSQKLKILYLQDEIRQMHEKFFDMEEMLKLNKDALKMSLNLTTGSLYKKPTNSNSTQDKSTKEEEITLEKTLKGIISNLDHENSKLLKSIEKLSRERNAAQSKALINEQIAEEAQKHELDITREFELKSLELLNLVSDKEKKLQELEKIKPIMDRDGLIVQYREILSPSEQVMKLHNELEGMRSMLVKVIKEVGRLQGEKKEVLNINFSLVTELNKLRVSMVSPLNSIKQVENMQDLSLSAIALLNFHKKFLEDSSGESDQLSPTMNPFPEKVIRNQKKERSDTTPDMKPVIGGRTMKLPMIKIPKLDLTQAKKIQEINAKKSSQQALPKADNKVLERYHNIEIELEKTKKLLQKEMSSNKLFQEENEFVKHHIAELLSINGHLTRSQQQYEAKWKGLFHALQFYKDFYHKYLELILSNVSNKGSEQQNLEKYREQNNVFEQLLRDPEKLIRDQRRKHEEDGRMLNVSILDLKDEENFEAKALVPKPGRNEFKNYILTLAKDVDSLWNNEKGSLLPVVKFRKSLSNPIEYQSEGKRNLLLESFEKVMVKKEGKLGNRYSIKSPAFGAKNNNNNSYVNNSVEDLGLESPEQIIFHTNYEEEEM